MEFSHVYARAGTKVTILEVMPRLLPNIDADAVAAIQAESERIGITIKTSVNIKEISKADGKLSVICEHDVAEHTVAGDRVVNGAGRTANVDSLDLEAANVNMADWFSGKAYAESVAFAKVLVDEAEDEIVGAQMVGHSGEELIHIFSMAMRHDIPASKLKEDMFAFPTFSSDLKNLF
jgi:pyruvate/2-oxoglutarate dehydrogenase complex dihydrolipoamide dehydrogenase (E3) component